MDQDRTILRRRLSGIFWTTLLVWMAVVFLALTGLGGKDSPLTTISTVLSILLPVLALVILLLSRRFG